MLTNIKSQVLRAIFRVYFIVVIALLGIIGQQCCKYAVKLRLARGKRVMLSEMTGWVRLSDLASSFLKLHRLPGGPWLGSIMLFASVFALVADLAVNVLVLNKSVVKRCEFDQGLVIQVPLPGASQWGSPPPLGYPALIASNAQWNSFTNDGLVGIYRKANSDVNFMAQPEDVMGFWQCSNPTNETYDSSWDADSIGADLQSKGLLYDVGTPSHNMDSNNLGQSTHIIIWGASIEDGQKGAFKVKAAVQLGGDYASDKYMMAFDCSAYSNNYISGDSDNINTIMSYMVANETIFQWAGSLQTTIYDGAGTTANPDTGFFLAMTLNTIIMVEGGGDVVDSYPTADSGFDQGCFVYTTWVSPFIFALLGLAALALISMIAYFLILILRLGIGLRFFSRGKQSTASINSLPDSLFGWMLHSACESAYGEQYGRPVNLEVVPNHTNSLNDWVFQTVEDPNGKHTRLVRVNGVPEPLMRNIEKTESGPGWVVTEQEIK